MDFCDRSLRNEDYMRYIDSLHEGERVTSIYMCKQKNAATTKNGKPYENVLCRTEQEPLTLRYGSLIPWE